MAYNIQWFYHAWTLNDFRREASTIDCNPIWQRTNVDTLFSSSSKPSKAQSIIAAILSGLDIGEVKLCWYQGQRASVDGGNRKRAILSFLNNEFQLHRKSPWGQKFFKDLPKDVREFFENYKLRVIIYDDLPSNLIGLTFRTINTVTEVNPQEQRNSYGRDPLACLIRELVRVIPELSNSTHELYAIKNSTKDGEQRYKYLAFNNNRLKMEDQLARIVYRIIEGQDPKKKFAGPSPESALFEMYDTVGIRWESNPDEKAKITKKVNEALDFFQKVANAANTRRGGQGIGIGQFSLLTRIYFRMRDNYGDFKVDNYIDFWDQFARAFLSVESRRDLIRVEDKNGNFVEGDRTVGEAFRGYLSFDIPQEWKYNDTLTWFLEYFDPLNVITVKDKKRCFTAKQIEDRLIQQNWTDFIDGKPLALENAVGAHRIAHSNGGKTIEDNLAVISAEHNTAMGSMDVDSYKAWYEANERKLNS